MIRAAVDGLLSVVLTPCCAACGDVLDAPLLGPVCPRCWDAIPQPSGPLCPTCGDTLQTWRAPTQPPALCGRCTRTPRVITAGRSIAPYEGALREVLHALKYGARRSVAPRLARLMAKAGPDVLRNADVVVPVPLHVWRLYTRGFNQAAELARHLELPVVHALRRRRRTVTQTELSERERHANVRGAFAANRRARQIAGRVVVLVDDVSTTGATLDACARVLLEAGSRDVRALTAARAAARLP